MRKYLYYLILFFSFISFSNLNSQKTKAIVAFKDGTIKEGLARLSEESLSFKPQKKSKPVLHHSALIDSVQLYKQRIPTVLVYQVLSNRKEPKVVRRLVEGKASLYYSGGGNHRTYIIDRHNTGSISSPINIYVKKEGDKVASHLGSNKRLSKNFKKAAGEFFKDCNTLVEKINQAKVVSY